MRRNQVTASTGDPTMNYEELRTDRRGLHARYNAHVTVFPIPYGTTSVHCMPKKKGTYIFIAMSGNLFSKERNYVYACTCGLLMKENLFSSSDQISKF